MARRKPRALPKVGDKVDIVIKGHMRGVVSTKFFMGDTNSCGTHDQGGAYDFAYDGALGDPVHPHVNIPLGTSVGFRDGPAILAGEIVSTWQDGGSPGYKHKRYQVEVSKSRLDGDIGEWNVHPEDILFILPGDAPDEIEKWLAS